MSQLSTGELLRHYRQARRFSQPELARLLGVSGRHLSFVETGRGAPSRKLLLHASVVLGLDGEATNRLLHAAGFADLHESLPWDDRALWPEREAASQALAGWPWPALLMTADGEVREANAALDRWLSPLATPGGNLFANLLNLVADGDSPLQQGPALLAGLMRYWLQAEKLLANAEARRWLLKARAVAPEDWMLPTAEPRLSLQWQLPEGQPINTLALGFLASRFPFSQPLPVHELVILQGFPADEPTRWFFEQACRDARLW